MQWGSASQPAAVARGGFRLRVELALVVLLPIRQVRHIGERAAVEVRPVVEHLHDVGPGARLDRGGDARLQVVFVDGLEHDLHLHLLPVLRQLALELRLTLRNEVHAVEQLQARALGEGGRPAGCQYSGQPRGATREKASAIHHATPSRSANSAPSYARTFQTGDFLGCCFAGSYGSVPVDWLRSLTS